MVLCQGLTVTEFSEESVEAVLAAGNVPSPRCESERTLSSLL